MIGRLFLAVSCFFILSESADKSWAQNWSLRENPELSQYFEKQVSGLERKNELSQIGSIEQWESTKPQPREQLFDMLGLSPRPARTPLMAETTGIVEQDEFVVERVHFQSVPGLYVTGNFYRPKNVERPLPTILYVCGHSLIKKDGVSFGNKTHYHYRGAWFARNGYCRLTIDTVQLGEIEGVHHGTYKLNRWWWNSRGYTPAGVEAWNCIRALDYLETRPEVDAKRIGVTGRSGGGAYSWWIAALDDRIRCAVPVAGITSLRDHLINGCVEGHCDCMYIVNTFRWDFSKVAALVALRPLLISNTDNDTIFPLEGVVDIHRQVRHIYKLYQAEQNLGLQITEGPHADTQELHIHAFRWFNRFLRDDTTMIAKTADRYNDADWKASTAVRMESLPTDELPEAEISKFQHLRIHFDSQLHVPLFADVVLGPQESLSSIESATILVTADPIKAVSDAFSRKKSPLIVFCPRGMGPHSWIGNDAKQIQIARRFQLIGTTPDAMRVWDIRRAMQIVRDSCTSLRQPAHLTADQNIHLEAMTLLASLLPASIVQFERLPTPLESVAMA